MSLQSKPRMTVDAFLAWAEGQHGRYELVDGEIVAMSPERARHVRVKRVVADVLDAAIRTAQIPCEAFVDGLAVRIDAGTSFVPDVLVHCGEPVDPDAMEAPKPVIVVEVVSPSSTSIDTNRKLEGYFRVPSIAHYLIVEPRRPMVIHHRRGGASGIETAIVSGGTLDLDPPGLSLAVGNLFTGR